MMLELDSILSQRYTDVSVWLYRRITHLKLCTNRQFSLFGLNSLVLRLEKNVKKMYISYAVNLTKYTFLE